MASSSDEALDDSIPEMVYQCSSSIDGTSSKREDVFLKCPLCSQFSKCFYCTDCVRNGNFTHSQKKCFERFADKKPKKYKLEEEKNAIIKRYEEVLRHKKEVEIVKFKIKLSKERILLQKQNIEVRKREVERDADNIYDIYCKSEGIKRQQALLTERINKLKSSHEAGDAEIKKKSNQLVSVQSAFQTISQKWICTLKDNIFPIIKTPLSYHRNATSSEEGQCAELEEAQKTTYVQGQWVITGTPTDDIQYAIVDVPVPGTGDYSAYTNWCAKHEPLATYRWQWSSLDQHRFDRAYGISAGLAYAAQLVNIVAFYLDVHVPKRVTYNDFCMYEDDIKFSHNVAKLNANIIHLCLHRNVDVTKLSAHRTMSNLMLVFEPPETHRALSSEDKEDCLESMEDSICKDLLSSEESDEESDADFEYITSEEVPKTEAPAPTSNIISSVVSSIYSFTTGRR